MHECDDRVERIALMCVSMWLRSMPVKHLAAARQLAGKRGALAQEAYLTKHEAVRVLEQQYLACRECANH